MAERELKATLAEKRDGVGIITLNRPEKLNAINQDIMDDLYYLFARTRRIPRSASSC